MTHLKLQKLQKVDIYGSQQHEVKFQAQVFTKFQDIFRPQEAQHIVNAYFVLNTNHS